jgi:predicted nucleotide-binding protein
VPLSDAFRSRGEEKSWYDTMQVCLNGHVINDCFKAHPQFNRNFCEKCGAATTTTCKNCGKGIRGYYHAAGVVSLISKNKPPGRCGECGEPYPWTGKKTQDAEKPPTVIVPVRVGADAKNNPSKGSEMTDTTNKVFIVHGHNEEMKQAVARVLAQLKMTPIILHEQANERATIIEKFEKHADVGFAIVLLSGDDMAYPAKGLPADARPRARQNVILELGYFVGKLGRSGVFALYMRGVSIELPSDFAGVVYTEYDTAGHWKFELVRELKARKYNVDANDLI